MSGIAGVRRTRTAPIVLAGCSFPELLTGSRVLVTDLSGADEPDYVADVVFGPQHVIAVTGCTTTARIKHVLPDDVTATRAAGGAPLWIGLAPPEVFPPAGMGQSLPRDAAEVAAAGAALLAEIESNRYDLHGFAHDLPALEQEFVLADGSTATVIGIDGKHGVLRARLAGGQEIEGPLPSSEGLSTWSGVPRATDQGPHRDRGERSRRRRSERG